ncbi:Ubiquinone biosynthesis O-methyltransferase [subsurface metagenome]
MFDNIRNRLALAILPGSVKKDATSPFKVIATQPADIPVYSDMTVRKTTREGYKMSPSVYRAIRVIVQAASAIPWIVEDSKGEPIEGHEFAKVWAKPNLEFSGQDNMEFVIAHLLLVGNSLIQPIIVNRRPREFWVVMPDLVQPIPSDVPGEWLKGWRVTPANGRQYDAPPEQFIHFMQVDPGNPYWGIGPLMAAARTVDTDNEAQDTQKISMQNRATPDGVFEADNMTSEQYEEAERAIRERYLSKEKRRLPWVVAGAKWHQMSLTPVEMDYIKSRIHNKRDIAGAFGISPIFLGDLEQSTYSNMMEARKALYEDVVIPLLDDIKATLNLKIAPMYGDIVISYDVTGIPALRADYGKKVDQAKILWSMGVPFDQINERLEMGFEEFPGWDRGYLPLTLLPTGASSAPEKLGAPTLSYKALNLQTEEQKTAHWKRIDRRRIGWWGVVSSKVKPLYEDEAKAIEKALKTVKALSPRDWEEAYSDEPPHWAVDLTPSLFAQDFALELADKKLKSVLEIGCGNGRDSIFFARAGLEVSAIDVAPSAIKLAKENAKEAEVSIDFKVANAEKLPFDDGQFEAVFTLSVLHATKLEKSLPEVNRVLEKDGLAFVYIYGDTQFAGGKREEVITVDKYLELLKALNFTVLDFYSEQEDSFDEFGEKHLIIVSLLQKAGEPK